MRKLFSLCPRRHILLAVSAAVIASHLLLRQNHALMRSISEKVIHPLHVKMALLNSHLPFSAAEVLIGLAVFATAGYLLYVLAALIMRPEKRKTLYRAFITLLTAAVTVYAGFCLLWGVYYYGDDFIDKSGLDDSPISTQELCTVTERFAQLVNEYSGKVERDENGSCCADRETILAAAPDVFQNIEADFPCLAGPALAPKGIHFSRIMSLTDFTGFFFPFTAEANVNTDSPVCFFASTVVHEMCHQRGVAKEKEADFTAIMTCLASGEPEYIYSAALLGYVHLGNALYDADYMAWKEIYCSLNELVIRDITENRLYWEQFETPVETVSNAVYDSFLKSYDQPDGIKSYGKCVDLLVNYYADKNLLG